MSLNCVVIEPAALGEFRSKRVRHDSYHRINSDEVYQSFFITHTCYDCMPKSGKVLLLDARLSIRKAFFALVFNGVRAALVWHAPTSSTIGLITISDFINMLIAAYDSKWNSLDTLETSSILEWKQDLLKTSNKLMKPNIIQLSPQDSLYTAILTLIEHKIHRIPVIDPLTHDFLFLITHKRILKFLYLYIYDLPQPQFIHQTLDELKIGTYENLILIDLQSKLIEVLRKFQSLRISALPVVDSEKRLHDVYSKFDIMHLAATRTYANLDVPLCDILDSIHDHNTRQLATCKKNDQLFGLMDKFVTREVHRLIIIDDNQHILGIFSMSDLMRFLVSTFENLSRTNSNTSTSTSNGPVFEGEPMDT
jgi:5'-AMP-activated protein kinase regulatory gamma subunit